MKVNIKDKEIELKYSFRSFIVYENITNQPFQPTGKIGDFIVFFYSTIMASDLTLALDYDEFIDWLDKNPDELENFIGWLTTNVNKNNNLTKKSDHKKKGTKSKNQ